MPGHKGKGALGFEELDITEISGADVLYSANGIIAESERNATELFGSAHTFYSAEGSTLAIKAMLKLAMSGADDGTRPTVLAARNVHKAFVYAAALLDFDVEWLYGEGDGHICACNITPSGLDTALSTMSTRPFAVYITSPDYLGNIADIKGLSEVCDRYGVPLLVDNAHGAYLAFLEPSLHPIALGASMCADSAHKTLPVLTGGAYLHVAKKAAHFANDARAALSLFASTSPSYLILQSLDLANEYLSNGYEKKLDGSVKLIEKTRLELAARGFSAEQTEPLKIVIRASKHGYTGDGLAELLLKENIECEFSDRDYLVLMATPENTAEDFERLIQAFDKLVPKEPLSEIGAKAPRGERKMSIREAIFKQSERIPTEESVGRILASPTVSCPPAVPIAVSGEEITEITVNALLCYGIDEVEVVKQN